MNKLLFNVVISFKKEAYIVLGTLAFILFLPLISVVVIANAGVAAVSQALAAVNPVTHIVEIFDSKGNKVGERELSTVWPIKGTITDTFGAYEDFRVNLGLGAHTGIDIGANAGTPITPFAKGKVIMVQDVVRDACGLGVKIDHGGGVESLYCHMSKTNATVGQDVKPGDVIGYVGTTGASTGNHLHFQINVHGIPVNPRTFMAGELNNE